LPLGEKFTSKSLLDSPAKTYQKIEEERLKNSIDSQKKELKRLESLTREQAVKREAEAELTKQSLMSMKSMIDFDFDLLVDFVSGNIKYIVDVGYDGMYISKASEFNEKMTYFDGWGQSVKFDGVRLISLLGKSGGDLSFNINRYSDGSGSSTQIKLIRSDDELKSHYIEILNKRLDAGKLSVEDIEKVSEHISVPKDIVSTVFDKHLDNIRQRQKNEKENMKDKHKAELARIQESLVKINGGK